ncbi:recombinase family protein [Clostridium sp.]|uniref:recombinase family protein n=2 Tax=Clostridium sp. TaxID=1506 RepID=UPI0039930345
MFNKKVLEEIFNNHSKVLEGSVHKEYNVGNDIILYVHQNSSRIVLSAINEKTDRQLNLKAAKYKEIIERFNEIGVLSSDKYLLKIDIIDKTKNLREDSFNKMKLRLEKSIEPDKKEIFEISKVPKKISKIYGYCRVSSKSQLDNNSLEQQEREIIEKYYNAEIYKEQYSGTKKERPIFNEVVSKVSKGDILVVTKLDRLARTVKEGIEIIEDLFKKGVAVHVLNVGLLEDTTMGRFFMTTMLAVAEMERNLLLERTHAGKEIAKTKAGFRDGRPKKYKKKVMEYALSLLKINGGTMSYKEVERETGISKSTLIRENNIRKVLKK